MFGGGADAWIAALPTALDNYKNNSCLRLLHKRQRHFLCTKL